MMVEQRIKFETAKLARNKGFHWLTLGQVNLNKSHIPEDKGNYCYNDEGKEISPKFYSLYNNHYPRPTQELLAKWLREKHELHVIPFIDMGKLFIYHWIILNEGFNHNPYELSYTDFADFSKYEDCYEAALYFCLNLLPDEK